MDSILILTGAIAGIVVLSVGISTGLLYLALSHGPFRQAIPALSIIIFPVILITFLSRFGHLSANRIEITHWKILIIIGLLVTILVLLKHYRDVGRLFFTRATALATMSGVASLGLYCLLNSTQPFAFNYLGNGEFLTYARLASVMLNKEPTLPSFFEHHQLLRYGQDIFLGVLADIFQRHPIELMHVASGYLLLAYGVVVGFIIATVFGSTTLTIMLLMINSVMLLPLFNYSASFFSSTIILAPTLMVLFYCATALGWKEPDGTNSKFLVLNIIGEASLLTLFITFVAISYPEFGVPVIGTSVGLVFYRTCISRKLSRSFITLSIAIIAVLIINFPLAISRIKGFLGQLVSSGGWNIFGDPHNELNRFMLNIVGLSFPLTSRHFPFPIFIQYAAFVGCAIIVVTALWQGRSHRPNILAVVYLWLALGMLVLLLPLFTGGHWYPAAKYFAQYGIGFVLILGLAFCDGMQSLDARVKWGAHTVMAAVFVLYLSVGVYEVLFAKKDIEVLNFASWTDLLTTQDKAIPLLVFKENDGEVIWFTELVAKHMGLQLVPVFAGQAERLARGPVPDPISCGSNNKSSNYEFSTAPYSYPQILALVGTDDPYGRLSTRQGVSLSVSKQETIASIGAFRFDRVSFDTSPTFSFSQGAWAIGGGWSACIGPQYREVALEFEVPETLVLSGPVNVELQFANQGTSLRVFKAGRYTLSVKADAGRRSAELIVLTSSKTWLPAEQGANSANGGRLGVSVRALSVR